MREKQQQQKQQKTTTHNCLFKHSGIIKTCELP